jgi:hypothetical protein
MCMVASEGWLATQSGTRSRKESGRWQRRSVLDTDTVFPAAANTDMPAWTATVSRSDWSLWRRRSRGR